MEALRLVAMVVLAIASTRAGYQEQRPDTVRVLFIGSSYTYYNNLPGMLEILAASRPSGPAVEVAMVVEGGATLTEHAESERTLETIRQGGWDFVVLQGQSTFGSVHLVDGQFRVGDPSGFYRGATALAAEVRDAGAHPLLLQHWKTRDAPFRDHRKIAFSFMHIGRELEAEVVPVGLAWAAVLENETVGVDLYASDGSHPGPAGSYLAAAVLYEVLTGQSSAGLPAEVRGSPVDSRSEEVIPDSTAVLVSLAPDQARTLQEAAHSAVQRLRAGGGYLDLEDPGPPETPHLPPASPVDSTEVEGLWSGPLTVYPAPATLVLAISRDAEGWSLSAEVTFGGRPDDIIIEPEELSITTEGIRFVDPTGPNGGEVRYEGVWTDQGLAGIAEIVVEGAPIYGIGTWTLRKEASAPPP